MKPTLFPRPLRPSGFSLVELLVAMTILAGVMALVFSTTDETAKLWKRTSSKIEQFQATRAGFESMTRRISQATLNTYYEYYDAQGQVSSVNPTRYDRYSELHFLTGFSGDKANIAPPPGLQGQNPAVRILGTAAVAANYPGTCIGFQAPLGYSDIPSATVPDTKNLNNMLNTVGYWVEFDNVSEMPKFIASLPGRSGGTNIYRYKLMQYLEPTHLNQIYLARAFANPDPRKPSVSMNTWFTSAVDLKGANQQVIKATRTAYRQTLSENVVLLLTLPQLPERERNALNNNNPSTANAPGEIAPNFVYNTRVGMNDKGFDKYLPATSTRSRQYHQLPPQVRVVMVAIDEDTAERLCPTGSASATPPNAVKNAYAPSMFLNSFDLDNDLGEYVKRLTGNSDGIRINYRVFDAVIPIQSAKWSAD